MGFSFFNLDFSSAFGPEKYCNEFYGNSGNGNKISTFGAWQDENSDVDLNLTL